MDESSRPALTVLMAVHNDERHLGTAIESILTQTFDDFEFIIVEDGSIDRSPAILSDYAQRDQRIRILRNPDNLGLTRSLNRGLEEARGRFIARMDSDDISLPRRFELQLQQFKNNSGVVLCGTRTISIDADGRRRAYGGGPSDIRVMQWYSVFRPAVAHPTAMFRAKLLHAGLRYDESLRTAQDFDMWSRMLRHGDATVLHTPLLLYREHPASISSRKNEEQALTAARICQENLLRRYPRIFRGKASKRANHLSAFLYKTNKFKEEQLNSVLQTLFEVEREELNASPTNRSQRGEIRRLTARWIMLALTNNPHLDWGTRAKTLSSMPSHWIAAIQELGLSITRRLHARITQDQ